MSGIGNQGRLAFSYIRMSTDTQLKGHSKQRQLEKSAAYAKVHGLELADELQLEDIGVSAFKGDNVKEGALGRFLHAVEKGRVPAGSYLLVESLDRISRQEVLKSLSLFLRIIDFGNKTRHVAGQQNLPRAERRPARVDLFADDHEPCARRVAGQKRPRRRCLGEQAVAGKVPQAYKMVSRLVAS